MSREASRAVRVARAAARRATLGDLFRRTGRSMCWGAALSALLVGADRLGLSWAPWPVLVFGPVGAALLGALAYTVLRPRGVMFGAGAVDRALGLKDRVSTGVALTLQRHPDEPFAAWARADADDAASRASVPKAVPLRAEWTWGAWPTLLAGCIAAALFVPMLTWDGESGQTPARQLVARREAAQRIEQAAETVREAIAADPGDIATPQELAAIEDLQRELEAGSADPRQAVTKAAGELSALSERTDREAERLARAHDALREQLSSAGADDAIPEDRAAAPLEEALSRGDLEGAGEAAGDLARDAGRLTPLEQLELARDLERLADAVSPDEREAAPDPGREELREELERQGLTPDQIEQVERPSDPETAAEELEKQGVPPEAARKQAEKIAEQAERRDAEESAKERMRELERRLRESAERLRNPDPEPQARPEGEPTPSDAPPAPDRAAPKEGDPSQPTDPNRPVGERPSQAREGQPRPSPPGSPEPQPREQPRPGDPKQPGQPEGTPEAQPDQPQPGQQFEPTGRPKGDPQPGGQPQRLPDEQPQQAPGEQPQQGPGEDPKPRPGTPGTAPSERPGEKPAPGGLEGLRQTLERMAQEPRNAQRQAQQAERFRDAAEELMKGGSDEDRRKLAERWGGAGSGNRGDVQRKSATRWAAGDAPVDARRGPGEGERPQERVIAEWYSPRTVDRTGTAPPAAGEMQKDIRQAARGAERAIEQQAVSPRYSDLVRRVFRRYEERAAPPPGGP